MIKIMTEPPKTNTEPLPDIYTHTHKDKLITEPTVNSNYDPLVL